MSKRIAIGLATFAAVWLPGGASVAAPRDTPAWTGTVTIVEDANHVFNGKDSNGNPLTTTLTYHDEAHYTLSGQATPDGLQTAQMTGSGQGRATGTDPASCVAVADPLRKWSYGGAAAVAVTLSGGTVTVAPQGVATTFTTVVDNSVCPGGGSAQTSTVQAAAPYGIDQIHPQPQSTPDTATALSGSATFPLTFLGAGITEPAGTATLTWSLQRVGAPPPPSPPSGTPQGTVLVGGKPFSGGPIAYGSTVDVTNGRLALQTEAGTLTVSGQGVPAAFKLLRTTAGGKTVVELLLTGGSFACGNGLRDGPGKPPPKTVRRLFAKGKGNFETRGRYASATVRGTSWLTADRCDGTLVQTFQGTVSVKDLVRRKTVLVGAGKSYLARKR